MSNKKNLLTILAIFVSLIALQKSTATPPHPGPELVFKHGCQNCHMIGGDGGAVGPPLDGIKDHRDMDYIMQKLTNPNPPKYACAYPVPQELMSHLNISKVEAQFIAEYLLTLSAKNLKIGGHGKIVAEAPPGSHFVPQAKSASSERGLKLYTQKGCIACHSIGPGGGTLAPNLAGVGARRSRKFITDRIAEGAILLPKPDQNSGQYSMPALKLKPSEIDDITNWLLTLPKYEEKSNQEKQEKNKGASKAHKYENYVSNEFKYSIEYPSDELILDTRFMKGPGLILDSADKRTFMHTDLETPFHFEDGHKLSIEEVYKDAQTEGGKVIRKEKGDNWFIVARAGTSMDPRYVYKKVIFGKTKKDPLFIKTFEIVYPSSKFSEYIPMIKHISDSFQNIP